jgi:hypothetical protein
MTSDGTDETLQSDLLVMTRRADPCTPPADRALYQAEFVRRQKVHADAVAADVAKGLIPDPVVEAAEMAAANAARVLLDTESEK